MSSHPVAQTLQPLADTDGFVIVSVSGDGTIQYANTAALGFFGLPAHSIAEMPASHLFEHPQHVTVLIENARENGSASLARIQVRQADGSLRDIDVCAFPCGAHQDDQPAAILVFGEPGAAGGGNQAFSDRFTRFQQVSRSARIGLVEWDIAANTVTIDRVIRDMLGIEGETDTYEYETLAALVPDTIRDTAEAGMMAFLAGDGIEHTVELPVDLPGGAQKWLRLSSVVFRNDDGSPCCLIGVATDTTDTIQSSKQIEERLRYEHGIAAISNLLVGTERGEAVVDDCMQILLETTDVSRVYIFENFLDPSDGLCMRQTHEVCAKGVTPEIDNPILQHLPYLDGYMRWHASLSAGDPVFGLVSEFPDEERKVLEPQDIKSLLVLPLDIHREWVGFIGFDHTVHSREWTSEDILLLRTAAELIGIYIGRVRDQEQLRMSEECFRGAFNYSPIGMTLIDLDGSLIDANTSFAHMLGYPIETMRSRKLTDVLRLVDELTLISAFDDIRRQPMNRIRFEMQAHHEQGHLVWLDINLSLILQADDTPTFFLVQFQDISERRQAEAALRESEERYKVLFQSSDTINIIIDPETGRVIDGNDTALTFFHIPRITLVSSEISDQHLFDDGRILERIREALTEGEMLEYRFTHRDNSPINLEIYPTPVVIARQEYLFLMIRDVTQRKRLEEQLLIRQKMDSLGDLAGGMAHDFNNLLTGVMGNLDLLRFDFTEFSAQHREYINEAYSCCLKSSSLLKKIQLLSKSTFYEKVVIDTSLIGNEIVDLLNRMTDPQIEMRCDIRAGVYTVCMNPDHLRQVLMNLGTNAVRSIENRGVRDGDLIRISARKYTASLKNPRHFNPGEYVHIMFRDNGEGMSDEVKQRAFDPLFTTKRRGTQKGQGLGLAVVYNIISRHYNGYVELASRYGEGTTVHIYLPYSPATAEELDQYTSSDGILNQSC